MHRIAIILVLTLATAAAAQQQPAGSWQAVDQAVGDLDQLSRSLRHIETGLRRIGEQRSLFEFRPVDQSLMPTGERRYIRLGDGFRANIPRMDYLVPISRREAMLNIAPKRDGLFIELGPPDMVFELDPMSINAIEPHQPLTPAGPPPTDARINAMIDGRIDAFVQPQMVTSPYMPVVNE